MSKDFEHLQRQRGRLLWLFGTLMAAMCLTLVFVSWSPEQQTFEFEDRWPAIVGLCGLVAIFMLYVQYHHRELYAEETRLRDLAIRDASLQARFSELAFLFDPNTQHQLKLDLQGVLDLASQRMLPCLDANQSSIMLYNDSTGLLEVRAASGMDAERVLHATMKPGEGAAGQAFASGEVLNLTPEAARRRFADQPEHGRQIAAGLCVPMRFKGTPIGVVSATRSTGEAFRDLHATILTAFAEQCAATVVKASPLRDLPESLRNVA